MIRIKKSIPIIALTGFCLASSSSFGKPKAGDELPVTGATITKVVTGLPPQLADPVLNEKEHLLYMTGYNWALGQGTLMVFDADSLKTINQITTPTLNASAFPDEENGTLWVISNNSNANVSYSSAFLYSGRTLELLKTVQIPNLFVNQAAWNQNSGKFYLTGDGGVEVYDRHFNHVASVPGDNAGFLAINEKTNKIYVTNYWDATVSVIDGKTDTIVGNPIPVGVAATPDGCYANGQDYMKCTNYDTYSASDGVAVDPETNRIFVANVNDGTFAIIDGNTNQVSKIVALSEGLFAPDSLPGLNTALVVNWDRSTLQLVNEHTGDLIQTLQIGAPDSVNCLRIQWDSGTCSFYGNTAYGLTVSRNNKKIYVVATGDGSTNPDTTDPYVDSQLYVIHPNLKGEQSR